MVVPASAEAVGSYTMKVTMTHSLLQRKSPQTILSPHLYLSFRSVFTINLLIERGVAAFLSPRFHNVYPNQILRISMQIRGLIYHGWTMQSVD